MTVCSAQVKGNGYRLSWELRLRKPGLVRAAVKLSQGSVRANGGSGSGGGDQRRLVAALVTAKARKCRGRLCYGSGRDRESQGYGRDGSGRNWGGENMK